MQTAALLKKEAPKSAIYAIGKFTNPLQRKAIDEEDDALQMKQNPLQLQNGLDGEEEKPLQMKQATVQLMDGLDDQEEEPLQMKQNPLQRMEAEDEELLQKKENPLQLKKEGQNPLQLKQATDAHLQLQADETAAPQPKKNNTGLPDDLKAGVEALSGYSMDDVKVHYNSNKPAQLQALAYAQATDIHVAPGQEQHLPHEAWHVVQQKQGRVQPTLRMKKGIAINNDTGLESEADRMGSKAISFYSAVDILSSPQISHKLYIPDSVNPIAQPKFFRDGDWMQNVTDAVLIKKFETTTTNLWKALQNQGFVFIDACGSGANYSLDSKVITISSNWLSAIEEYVKQDVKEPVLLRAVSALTHEMSHAYDHQISNESPAGSSKENDDWVVAVLKTELRAWKNEAMSARQHIKSKKISTDVSNTDDKDLIGSWIALYFEGNNSMSYLSFRENKVITRLIKYYTDNRFKGSSELHILLKNILHPLIAKYAAELRSTYNADNATLQSLSVDYRR